MHLVPAEHAERRIIDGQRVCAAIEAVGNHDAVAAWAQRFATLGDPSRLALLICIHVAGPIAVSDLAVAAGMNDTTVSQALRLLRDRGLVTAERHGRVIRYQLADDSIHRLLHHMTSPATSEDRGAAP